MENSLGKGDYFRELRQESMKTSLKEHLKKRQPCKGLGKGHSKGVGPESKKALY